MRTYKETLTAIRHFNSAQVKWTSVTFYVPATILQDKLGLYTRASGGGPYIGTVLFFSQCSRIINFSSMYTAVKPPDTKIVNPVLRQFSVVVCTLANSINVCQGVLFSSDLHAPLRPDSQGVCGWGEEWMFCQKGRFREQENEREHAGQRVYLWHQNKPVFRQLAAAV